MIVYFNGRFVGREEATVSIFDRGFLYGDGLFESIRIYGGNPFLWAEHMDRFEKGAGCLGIRAPLTREEMRRVARELSRRTRVEDAILRITLSRGPGRRGYSPAGADHPTLALSLHEIGTPKQRGLEVIFANVRAPSQGRLGFCKHSNRLAEILGRAEADEAGADEALLLNSEGKVVEASSANLFWREGNSLATPPLDCGGLDGVTRDWVLRTARRLGIQVREKRIQPAQLLKMEGIFLTSSAIEVREVAQLEGRKIRRSALTAKLKREYRKAVALLG
jgi:aminodeoxychorismate lyase